MPAGAPTDEIVAPGALIDTHAHLQDCFDLETFLRSAADNFEDAGREMALGDQVAAAARVLLILGTGSATGGGTSGLGLEERLLESEESGWAIERADEAGFVLRHGEHGSLVLIEGRQIISSERLELLAAPCATDLPEGKDLGALIESAIELRAMPILPWGFGKWLGRRGRIIAALLDSSSPSRILLSDNGGRPRASLKPRLLTLGAQRGFRVVRGSDPLALPAEAKRPGSFGSFFAGPFDLRRPAASLRAALSGRAGPPRPFGRGVGMTRFLSNQIRLRLSGSRR